MKKALKRYLRRFGENKLKMDDEDKIARKCCAILDSESICKVCPHSKNPEDCVGLTACASALARILKETEGKNHD